MEGLSLLTSAGALLAPFLGWLESHSWAASWITAGGTILAVSLDVYFLLWRFYRKVWPMVRELTPEDMSLAGRGLKAQADRQREAEANYA